MSFARLKRHVSAFLGNQPDTSNGVPTGVPGLFAFESRKPTHIEAALYVPIVCLTLQGTKETIVGSTSRLFRTGETAIVSHALPVGSRVVEATTARPYLALVLFLDIGVLRSLFDQLGETVRDDAEGDAIAVAATDDAFTDAIARYFALSADPIEAQVLGPLIYKELHFRLLRAPHGGMLRRLLHLDSHASRVHRALTHIRQNYHHPISVPDLARIAGMSPSSFHAHFRSITETTPLQYQKELRLIEARRLMCDDGRSVSSAAFQVGYESPAQFSRDYSRKFGLSPRKDLVHSAIR